jgi:hypothetical protein
MLDDTSVGGSSSIPRQKYMAKAADLGLDEVEYDGFTYKFAWQSLQHTIYRHLIFKSMVLLLIMALMVALLVLTAESSRQPTKWSITSTSRVLVTTSLLNNVLSQWVPSHNPTEDQ